MAKHSKCCIGGFVKSTPFSLGILWPSLEVQSLVRIRVVEAPKIAPKKRLVFKVIKVYIVNAVLEASRRHALLL